MIISTAGSSDVAGKISSQFNPSKRHVHVMTNFFPDVLYSVNILQSLQKQNNKVLSWILNHHKIGSCSSHRLTALSPAAPSVFQEEGREAELKYVFMDQIFLVPCCLHICITIYIPAMFFVHKLMSANYSLSFEIYSRCCVSVTSNGKGVILHLAEIIYAEKWPPV